MKEFLTWLNEMEYEILAIPVPDMTLFLHMKPEIGQELVEKKGEREEGVERAEKIKSVQVSGNLSASDPAVLLRSSLLGLGISLQPKYATMSYFDSQQLIQLFPEYTPKPLTIYGVYKSREYMPKAMRVLIDELALYIESLDL